MRKVDRRARKNGNARVSDQGDTCSVDSSFITITVNSRFRVLDLVNSAPTLSMCDTHLYPGALRASSGAVASGPKRTSFRWSYRACNCCSSPPPERRTLNYANAFFQDSISLSRTLTLVVGTKYEHDAYTRGEPLPNARLSWKVSDRNLLWTAVSRAVRAPSRLDRDLFEVLGPVVYIRGGNFQDERLTAYELGYRAQPSATLPCRSRLFITCIPICGAPNIQGGPHCRPFSPTAWRGILMASKRGATTRSASGGASASGAIGSTRTCISTLAAVPLRVPRSPAMTPLSNRTALDDDDGPQRIAVFGAASCRCVAESRVASYTELNAHVTWTGSPAIALALTGSNLIHPHHFEFGTTASPLQPGPTGVEAGRSVFFEVQCKF